MIISAHLYFLGAAIIRVLMSPGLLSLVYGVEDSDGRRYFHSVRALFLMPDSLHPTDENVMVSSEISTDSNVIANVVKFEMGDGHIFKRRSYEPFPVKTLEVAQAWLRGEDVEPQSWAIESH